MIEPRPADGRARSELPPQPQKVPTSFYAAMKVRCILDDEPRWTVWRGLVRWPRTFTGSADRSWLSLPHSILWWRGRVAGGVMAEPVRARRLTDQEGQRLQQIVRRVSTGRSGCGGR